MKGLPLFKVTNNYLNEWCYILILVVRGHKLILVYFIYYSQVEAIL